MANYWSFDVRIKGSGEAIDEFLGLTYAFGNTPPEDRWLDFAEIFDADKTFNPDGSVSVTLYCGNSKGPWSELIDADCARPGAVSLVDVSEELELDVEMYINGDEWATHLIISKGDEVLSEESEKLDPVCESDFYPTFEEWCKGYNLPEGTTLKDILDSENRALGSVCWDVNMSWDEFIEEADGEYFHFGGFPVVWHI